MHDVVVIGAGPAGLSAGLTATYFKLRVVVLDAAAAGGALITRYPWKKPDSCLGLKGHTAKEIAELYVNHVRSEGCEIMENEEVLDVKAGKSIRVRTCRKVFDTRTVVLATGTIGTPRKLGVPGEDSKNVAYFVKDPEQLSGRRVLVVGGGDSAVQNALAMDRAGANVWIAHRRDEFRCMDEAKAQVKGSGIRILWNTELKGVGRKKVKLLNNRTGRISEMSVDNVFIFCGSVMDKEFLKRVGVKTKGDLVVVDKDMKTSVQGVFAAGDITGGIKRIPQAIAQGETAVYSAYKYIKRPYWK